MEIYRNRPTTVRIQAPVPGAMYNTVKVSSASGETDAVPTYVDNYIPWNSPVLEIPIEFRHTWLDGQVTLEISVNDGSVEHSYEEYVDVVTPMFTTADLGNEYPAKDVPELERLVRHVIEAYTGQYFGKRKDRKVVSTSQKVLNFNVPLIEFTGVSDKYLTHSTTLNPPKIPYEVLNGGYTLALDLENYDVKTDSLWILNSRRQGTYVIEGMFGYDRVPQDVKQAALLIAGMWGCNQAVWRDRFINTMRSADWSVAYHDAGFGHTTGSHGADMLLSKYSQRYNPAVI